MKFCVGTPLIIFKCVSTQPVGIGRCIRTCNALMTFHRLTVLLFLWQRCYCSLLRFVDTVGWTATMRSWIINALCRTCESHLMMLLFHTFSFPVCLLNWRRAAASLSAALHCNLVFSISVAILHCFVHWLRNNVTLSKQLGWVYLIGLRFCPSTRGAVCLAVLVKQWNKWRQLWLLCNGLSFIADRKQHLFLNFPLRFSYRKSICICSLAETITGLISAAYFHCTTQRGTFGDVCWHLGRSCSMIKTQTKRERRKHAAANSQL